MEPQGQILVVDPAAHTAELEGYNLIAVNSPLPCSYHLPALFGMESIEKIPDRYVRGIVMFGSASSVYDNKEWQAPLDQWFLKSMNAGIPTLGLCYGHQLVAHLYGAKVRFYNESRHKFLGTRETSFHEDDRLGMPARQGPMIVSHNEVVSETPQGFESWAESELGSLDALRHKELPIWTTQAHAEATESFLDHQSIEGVDKSSLPFGQEVVQAFLGYCERTS